MTTQTLQNAILKAGSAWEAWNALGVSKRIEKLSKAAQELDQPITTWLMDRIGTTMPAAVDLPGPTGEANSLHWSGRGIICVCADANQVDLDNGAYDTAITAQLFTALATGNAVILQDTHKYMHRLHSVLLSAGIPEAVVQLVSASLHDLTQQEAFHAYAFCGTSDTLAPLNQQLAQRGGMLAQLISETQFDTYPTITSLDYPWRFVTESTLSVNTTAVGGNATLLELGGKNDL
ncbi:hypothetical protein [Neptunomonas sp.]|uniref:hypothetical protein n=1 Tax=Neptunomonas sp. TaxID=1971898 RepID=UPI0035663071